MTFIEANVLKLRDRTVIEKHYDSVVDYLSDNYPDGFGEKNCTISVNGIEQKVENYDVILADDAVVVLMFHPALAVGAIGGSVVTFMANLLISAAVSYVVGQIFRPSIPELQTSLSSRNRGQSSSVYSLNSQQNEAKIGAIIPIIYGSVRTYPALISPPYYRYEDNEEYLYQLMCIGQGNYSIDEILISDTNVETIAIDSFRYEKLAYDDFKTPALLDSKVNDSNYKQLVKAMPDIDNLELRGTPQNKSMIMRFSGSTIEFFPFADGGKPDLSLLSAGSIIKITDTVSNDGNYTVLSATSSVVTVSSHTFVTEPSDTKLISALDGGEYDRSIILDGNRGVIDSSSATTQGYKCDFGLETDTIVKLSGTVNNDSVELFVYKNEVCNPSWYINGYTEFIESLTSETLNNTTINANYHAKTYKAEFETSYGDFEVRKGNGDEINFIEVDVLLPNGLYNTDTSGNFIPRTVEFVIYVYYIGAAAYRTEHIFSYTEKDTIPVRVSELIPIENITDRVFFTMERITPEPEDFKSMDKIIIKNVKKIFPSPNYEPLGNISLLWCKVKATNAISAINQFSINAWVTRNDVSNDVKSVCTDIYTNDVYGGRLPENDLGLDETAGAVVNGAIDSKMTLFDAMQMIGKSNRYTVFPVGNEIKLKHDAAKPIRTALYNETNIIKDSLKIFYHFEEVDETDSVKITYRDSTEFKEVTAIYPAGGVFPDELELWGCTSESVALAMAKYLYKQDRARRKSIELKTDVQGLIPQFLDRIAVSHNIPNSGLGGQIVAVSGNNITIDCDFDLIAKTLECDDTFDCLEVFCKVNNFDTILFRDELGGVSDTYTFSVIGAKEIQLTATAPTWLNTTEAYDNTFFSISSIDSFVKDYIVTSVKPNGEEIKIEAVNYDESIYS